MNPLGGRKRKPTAMRLVDGNAGKRALPKHEPKPAAGEPPVPDTVAGSPVALKKWRALVRDLTLQGARVLTVADGHQLELAALTYEDWLRARRAGHDERAEKRQKALQGCLDRLGLNPVTRGKVETVADEDSKGKSPAASYF